MFSTIPPLRKIECAVPYGSMIRAYQIHHNTVTDVSYRSTGERRAESTHCIFHYTVRGHGEVIHKGKAYRTDPGEGFLISSTRPVPDTAILPGKPNRGSLLSSVLTAEIPAMLWRN